MHLINVGETSRILPRKFILDTLETGILSKVRTFAILFDSAGLYPRKKSRNVWEWILSDANASQTVINTLINGIIEYLGRDAITAR